MENLEKKSVLLLQESQNKSIMVFLTGCTKKKFWVQTKQCTSPKAVEKWPMLSLMTKTLRSLFTQNMATLKIHYRTDTQRIYGSNIQRLERQIQASKSMFLMILHQILH